MVGSLIVNTTVVADVFNVDEGLVSFEVDKFNVYHCSVERLLDISQEEHDADDDGLDKTDFLTSLGLTEKSRVIHENSALKEHKTVLPKEHD